MTDSEISNDRQRLINTLARYDSDLKVEDVVDTGNSTSFESNTLLLQILLEIACRNAEPNAQKRQTLFIRMWNKLIEAKFTERPIFHMDALFSVRNKAASEFEKEIMKENLKLKAGPLQSILYDPAMKQNLKKDSSLDPEKYEREFKELNRIGKGGFGTVWKAKHKIDGIIYAVKKIIFKYKKDSDYVKVIREVKSFATLNHLNVVGYNQAWFEYVHPSVSGKTDSKTLSCSSLCKESTNSEEENGCTNRLKCSESSSTSHDLHKSYSKSSNRCLESNTEETYDEFITFRDDLSSGAYGTFSKQLTNQSQLKECSSSHFSKVMSSYDSSDSEQNSYQSGKANYKKSSKNSKSWVVRNIPILRVMLYIQMEYCDSVLREWLDERANGTPLPFQLTVFEIFRDILNGVAHIHSKSIIHRDLKPQNIFFSSKNNAMKIGDFGLATLNDSLLLEQNKQSSTYYSTDCGTLPYAAPEQRSRHKYDSKVDMYSLGVILVELLIDAQTRMEFSSALNSILSGSVPEKLTTNWPEYVNLVKNLISKDPDTRLSAKEVLSTPPILTSFEVDQRNIMEIKYLKEALMEKDRRIKELEALLNQQALAEKDKRIKELEALLQNKNL